jgi:hypothetical protein
LASILTGTTFQLSPGYQAINCLVNLVFANLIDLKWAEFINPKTNAAKRAAAVLTRGNPCLSKFFESSHVHFLSSQMVTTLKRAICVHRGGAISREINDLSKFW